MSIEPPSPPVESIEPVRLMEPVAVMLTSPPSASGPPNTVITPGTLTVAPLMLTVPPTSEVDSARAVMPGVVVFPPTEMSPMLVRLMVPPGVPRASTLPMIAMVPASMLSVPPEAVVVPDARTKPLALTVSRPALIVIVPLPTSSAPPALMRSSRVPTSMTDRFVIATGVATTHGSALAAQRSFAVVASAGADSNSRSSA
jgi:hypothetical protein